MCDTNVCSYIYEFSFPPHSIHLCSCNWASELHTLQVTRQNFDALFLYMFFQYLNFVLLQLITVVSKRWRERNQQDATNQMFIIKLLSQHVSGITIPIIRRARLCTTAYGVLHWLSGAGNCVNSVKVAVSEFLLVILENSPVFCSTYQIPFNYML